MKQISKNKNCESLGIHRMWFSVILGIFEKYPKAKVDLDQI